MGVHDVAKSLDHAADGTLIWCVRIVKVCMGVDVRKILLDPSTPDYRVLLRSISSKFDSSYGG